MSDHPTWILVFELSIIGYGIGMLAGFAIANRIAGRQRRARIDRIVRASSDTPVQWEYFLAYNYPSVCSTPTGDTAWYGTIEEFTRGHVVEVPEE